MSTKANLRRLLQPRSIAFIGGRHAELALRQSRAIGYDGAVWPVNPKRESLGGVTCYPSIAALPEAPDAALVAVPAAPSVEVVRELSGAGAGGAVCFATGFAEVGGEGVRLQQALTEAAGDMALVGPNCTGLLNYLDGAALWPDEQGGERCRRGAAILSQSGNVAINLTMQERSLPLSYVISLGNQAGLGIADYIEGLLEDPRVTAIGLYLEQLHDVPAFARAARQALEKGVPLVALKLGASDSGARSVMSHTSALAGSDALYQALFQRTGVARVDSPAALLETLKLFTVSGIPAGRRLISLSCSGGEAALVGDLAEAGSLPLEFPQPNAARADRLSELLRVPPTAVANPFDYNTAHWGDAAALEPAFAASLEAVDMGLLLLDYPRAGRGDPAAWEASEQAFIAASRGRGQVTAIASTLAESLPAPVRERLVAAGIAPLQGLSEALTALAAAGDYGARRPALLAEPVAPPLPAAPLTVGGHPLSEAEGKACLAGYGLSVPESRVVQASEVVAAAEALGWPLVLKAVHPVLAHKTEAGAVALNLRSKEEVAAALTAMRRQLEGGPAAEADFLVERMVEDSVAEVILGLQVSPPFGPSLLLGYGGILAELVGDSVSLLLPTSEAAVREALGKLKVSRLLNGWRGRPAGDVEAVVQAAMALARFAEAEADRLLECDLNPLLVRPEGQGAVAADVLLRLAS